MYSLKLDYGSPATVYKLTSTSTDYETGEVTRSVQKWSIRRAILMPLEVAVGRYTSPFYNQTNKPFVTKGTGWDEAARLFIIDGREAPGMDVDLDDYIICNDLRFDVKAYQELGDKDGWAIWTTQVKGHDVTREITAFASSGLILEDESNAES